MCKCQGLVVITQSPFLIAKIYLKLSNCALVIELWVGCYWLHERYLLAYQHSNAKPSSDDNHIFGS